MRTKFLQTSALTRRVVSGACLLITLNVMPDRATAISVSVPTEINGHDTKGARARVHVEAESTNDTNPTGSVEWQSELLTVGRNYRFAGNMELTEQINWPGTGGGDVASYTRPGVEFMVTVTVSNPYYWKRFRLSAPTTCPAAIKFERLLEQAKITLSDPGHAGNPADFALTVNWGCEVP